MRTEQEIFDLIMKIAKDDDRIRAAYMHGSRANPTVEKDKYSDYDIVFVVTETDSFIKDKDWANRFGEIAFVFEARRDENKFRMKAVNDFSRRYVWCMLFKDESRVDLIIEIKEETMKDSFIDNKRIVLLLDKDGILPEMTPPSNDEYYVKKPNEDEYTACCTYFWWFLNDVAKAIARDQLPYAKEQFESLIRHMLNRMMDWHIGVQTDFSVSTGKKGQYYKRYLSTDIYDLYTRTYSDGNYENFWSAIFASCELFRNIASGVGDFFDFVYNNQEENNMMDYLTKTKNLIVF